jgi:hypothetical protein
MLIFNGRGRGGVRDLQFLGNHQLLALYGKVGFCVYDVPNQSASYNDTTAARVHSAVALSENRILFSSLGRWQSHKGEALITDLTEKKVMTVDTYPIWTTYLPLTHLPTQNAVLLAPGSSLARAYDCDSWERRTDLDTFLHPPTLDTKSNLLHFCYSQSGRWAFELTAFRQFSPQTLEPATAVPLSITRPERVVFSRDERFALVWSAFKLYLIDLELRKCVRDYPACSRKVRDACFTPDNRSILQVSADRIVRMFDRESGQVLHEYTWDIGELQAVTVSPDGTLAAAGATAGTGKIIVWDLE